MATFPGNIKTFPTLVDLADSVLAIHQNERGDEITAIETFLQSALGEGQMWNGQIVPSVSSNNLTLALKTLDGGDPSGTDPVWVRIGTTIHQVTSSLSVTVNAGTNIFNAGSAELATLNVPYFPYLCYKSSDQSMVLLFSRIPHARTYGEFSGTATDEKYAAYSAAPAGTDNVVNIGYFEAINSGSASYNWSVPTFTTKNLRHAPTLQSNWMTYTPSWSASGSMTYTSITVKAARYRIVGDGVWVIVIGTGTTGGTASNTLIATLPFTLYNASSYVNASGYVVDGSLGLAGFTFLSGTQVNCRKNDSSNFGLGTLRTMSANISGVQIE